MTTTTTTMIEATHHADDATYRLRFPLSELANAIALCGWTLANSIRQTDEIATELARLELLPYLEIPDGRGWFAEFATRQSA